MNVNKQSYVKQNTWKTNNNRIIWPERQVCTNGLKNWSFTSEVPSKVNLLPKNSYSVNMFLPFFNLFLSPNHKEFHLKLLWNFTFYFIKRKSWKNYEKCLLFQLKHFFWFLNIQIFVNFHLLVRSFKI